jgi:hypothetical protein
LAIFQKWMFLNCYSCFGKFLISYDDI